jgi:splicing factor 3B subunit 4
MNSTAADRNTEATVHVGNLDSRVSDEQLWELFNSCGPVSSVYIPRDRITSQHKGFGFCEYRNELDAAYASKVLNMTMLYSKPIRLSQSSADRHVHDVGANLFVGNLAPAVDEKLLYEAFSAFGTIIDAPHIMRDPDTDASKGFGFVKFSTFEASDRAAGAMNGQYICNQPLVVQYAFKKDSDGRERHGSEAERLLAKSSANLAEKSLANSIVPHTMFSDRPPSAAPPPLSQPALVASYQPGNGYHQPFPAAGGYFQPSPPSGLFQKQFVQPLTQYQYQQHRQQQAAQWQHHAHQFAPVPGYQLHAYQAEHIAEMPPPPAPSYGTGTAPAAQFLPPPPPPPPPPAS